MRNFVKRLMKPLQYITTMPKHKAEVEGQTVQQISPEQTEKERKRKHRDDVVSKSPAPGSAMGFHRPTDQ